MSNTPRTDAALASECPRPSYLFTEFAQHLERELAEAQQEIERLKKNTGCARNQGSTQFCQEAVDAKNKATDWEEMAHELATALEYALNGEVGTPKSILKLYYKMKGTK
jgi:hypothetical protein